MEITNAVKCFTCGDIIFSRARHDFRSCECKEVAVDGGFDYTKISFMKHAPIKVFFEIHNVNKGDLFNDWNLKQNKFGRIKIADFSQVSNPENGWYISGYQEINDREGNYSVKM
jgi:hypothetical protein